MQAIGVRLPQGLYPNATTAVPRMWKGDRDRTRHIASFQNVERDESILRKVSDNGVSLGLQFD